MGWVGTDMNKLWFKSEGFVKHGRMTDGDQEALYDHPIPHSIFFDLQAGVRYDLGSNPGRAWGAIGIEGLLVLLVPVGTFSMMRGMRMRLHHFRRTARSSFT